MSLVVGYFGFPDQAVMAELRARGAKFIDLDVAAGAQASNLLPATSCRILRNIADNALALRDELTLVLASVGEEKCDGGRFVTRLLREQGLNVRETRVAPSTPRRPTPICTSDLSLRKKVVAIMDAVADPAAAAVRAPPCKPAAGFWGVPPNDLSLLDLFPLATHVYGWIRCVEAGAPADLELEEFVAGGVKTVFYAQTFCQKQILARALAEKHGGLFIDADEEASPSVRARIEAFFEL